MKKCKIIIVLTMFCLMFSSIIISTNAQEISQNELLYFINCGDENTEIEKGLNLKGSLGSGDRVYSNETHFGHEGKINANGTGEENIFDSYVNGKSVYKFDLEAGEYQLALGVRGNYKLSINGGQESENSQADKKIISQAVTSAGTVTVEFTGELSLIAILKKDSKILLNVDKTSSAILEYGKVVSASVNGYYSNGETQKVALEYNSINANDLNVNFSTFETVATVADTSYSFSQVIMVMPKDLVYFANCGSMISSDPTTNDVYYDYNKIVLGGFPRIKNNVPDQLYSNGATWGYTSYNASIATSGKPQPYPPAFPFNTIRCSNNDLSIEYTFEIEEGKYNVFLGTRSHWHSRKATPYINDEARELINLDSSNKVTAYQNVSAPGGKIKVKVTGPTTQDEGSISFIAIQPAEEIAAKPAKPTFSGELKLGQTEFKVSNVTKGSKVQISLGESPFSVLYEDEAVADGDKNIVIDKKKLKDVFKVRICSVTNGGASDYIEVYITDINNFIVKKENAYFSDKDVEISINAECESGIAKMEVTKDFLTQTFYYDFIQVFNSSYIAKENGTYAIKIYSGNGAFLEDTIVVDNIDRTAVTLKAVISLDNWQKDKISVSFKTDSVASIIAFRVYSGGKLINENANIPKVYKLTKGNYVFAVESSTGKIGVTSLSVGDLGNINTKITSSKDGFNVSLQQKDKMVSKITAYSIDGESATKLMTTDLSFDVYEQSDVAVLVEYADGTTEIGVIGIVATKKAGCGSQINTNSLLCFATLLTILCVIAFTNKKREII